MRILGRSQILGAATRFAVLPAPAVVTAPSASAEEQNIEAERCCEIRLRAERKAGELLRDMEKAGILTRHVLRGGQSGQ
jgi:hypothetical protein